MKFLILTAFIIVSNMLLANNTTHTSLTADSTVSKITVIKGFSAATAGAKTKLQWSVLSNQNASSIEVEYSHDGKRFTQVGLVWCSEQAATENYSLTVNNKSNTYYRLKLTCKDGVVVYADAIAVKK